MNKEQFQDLKKSIMRRVYFWYLISRLLSGRVLKLLIVAIFAIEMTPLSPLVSMGNVLGNMSSITDLRSLYYFQTTAFVQTELVVQLTLLAFVTVCAIYLYGLVKKISRSIFTY